MNAKFLLKTSWLAAVAGFMLGAVGVNAGVIFQADFAGSGGGTGGTTNLVTLGGTGAIVADGINMTANVTNLAPFTPGATNYLNVQRIANGGGVLPSVAFTFASATNSWTAWQGPNIPNPNNPGDGTYSNFTALSGAYDTFFRLDSGTGSDVGGFRPIDQIFTPGADGLLLVLQGLNGGIRLQISLPTYSNTNPPPILNFSGTPGSSTSLADADIYLPAQSLTIVTGQVYHVGITLNTDTNGLTTAALYVVAGTGPIGTGINNAVAYATFNLDAATVGTAFTDGTWDMEQGWGATGPFSIDYSTTRLYNNVPAAFAALPGTPTNSVGNGIAFEADFNGAGIGIGGTSNIVTYGGTAALQSSVGATNSVIGAFPFTAGSGDYLNNSITAALTTGGNGGQKGIVTFSPASGANNFSVFQGTNIPNGSNPNLLNLNGAVDLFVRPNVVEGGSSTWFRPIDMNNQSGTAGLRIIWSGNPNTSSNTSPITVQLGSGSGNRFSSSSAFTSFVSSEAVASSPITFTPGQIYHLGFTITTTPATGLITVNEFGVAGTGAINTSSSSNLIGTLSFYGDADVIGTAFSSSASWTMLERPDGGGASSVAWTANDSIDYDTVRLYSADPGTFAGLATPPPGFLKPVVSGGQITLSWTNSGTLLWSTNVTGPWTTNTAATSSPYTEPIVPNQNRFYRLQQ